MKKLISTLLIAVMIVCCFANVAFASAEGDAAISGNYVTSDAGEQVTVSFTASNLEYISYWFELNYDSALEIVSISSGGATVGSFQANAGTGRIAAANSENVTANGILFTVVFEVTDTAAVGDEYSVGLNVLEIRKQGGESVSPAVSSATVAIVCDHNYIGTITTPATCDKVGVKTYTCEHCGDSYTEDIAKSEHKYTAAVTKDATCKEEGVKTYTCAGCGDSYTEAIAKTEHSYTSTVTKEATCKDEGVRTFTCAVCGDSYTEAIAKTEHSYTSAVTKDATCKEEGVKTYTCAVCGDNYSEAISKIAHTAGNTWENDEDYHWHLCSACKEVMDKAEHKWNKVVDKSATATKDGYGHYECECGRVGEKYTIPATGEDLDDVPETGDITGLVTLGAAATLLVVLGMSVLVIKRKKVK